MKSFTYDKANQLATSTTGDKVTNYAYDAAGRLVKEGNKTYSYGYLDKILEVQENGKQIAAFDYHVGGQIASAVHGDKTENFLWDGLALIHRAGTNYINEPYVTGGNPILSSKYGVMFNDILGTTLGVAENGNFTATPKTAFGQPTTSQPNNLATEIDKVGFFTGKPYIGELGYAFLFRNYRAELGKWQTKDPLGYPDGWNNLAYVNNGVTNSIDWLGCLTVEQKQFIIEKLNSAANNSELIHKEEAQALLNTYNNNGVDGYSMALNAMNNADSLISSLNDALPDNAPGKNAINTLSSLLNAGNTIAESIKAASEGDPSFISAMLDLSGSKNLPGIGDYINFIDTSVNAISSALDRIKDDLAFQNIHQIDDKMIGDQNLKRIIESGWLVPYDDYLKELQKLQE